MKYKIYIFLFSIALMLSLGIFERGSACSVCSITPSFCEMVGEADVIFVGKTVGSKLQMTTNQNGIEEIWDVAEIYFEVQQSFAGGLKKGTHVTVRSGNSQGICGMWFKRNESYLIFAGGDTKKGFFTGRCSRTRLISEAQEDLESLRSLPRKGTGSKISGTVMTNPRSFPESDSRQPLSGLTLKIKQAEGKQRIFETLTDSNGFYEFKNVPAGNYEILPGLSKSFEFQTSTAKVKDRGCVIRDFLVNNKTKIGGKILDAEGEPVNSIFVELISTDSKENPKSFTFIKEDLTDENGKFTFENVPPGRFTLSVNYSSSPDEDDPFPTTFYPHAFEKSQAMVFDIKLGSEDIEDIEFLLPPRLEMQEIKGIVVWSDGTPAFDISVGLHNPEDGLSVSGNRTDKFGNFTLRGFFGRKYYISADNYTHINVKLILSTHTEDFIFNENVQFFRLVLEKKE